MARVAAATRAFGVRPDRGRTVSRSLLALVLAAGPVLASGLAAAPGTAAPDATDAAAPSRVLRFGAVGVYSPRIMYLKYQPLVDYLSAATGSPWELVISPSFERLAEDVCSGATALGVFSPFAYVRAHAACGALPVVKLTTGGSPTYRSLIVVRIDSDVQSLQQLAGRRFAFGVSMSTASQLVPREMLEAAGLRPGTDLDCRYYSRYEGAVRAVLLGEADACGVRDIVARRYLGQALRVLARSEEIPNPPLVVSPSAPPSLREELFRVLVSLPRRDAQAAAAIRGWDEELAGGFAAASDEDYAPIRRLALRLFGPAGLSDPAPTFGCGPGRP